MSIKSRVARLLGKFDRRVTLVEDSVERIEGAVDNILEMTTEMRAVARRLEGTAERLERAVSEQGKTLGNTLEGQRSESLIRAGLGREVMRLSARVDKLERGPEPNGAA